MTQPDEPPSAAELLAVRDAMARQHADALASIAPAQTIAQRVAVSLITTGEVVFLGSGSSHLCARMVAPLYRRLGFATQTVTLAEQLDAPQPLEGRTVLVTARSGDGAELHEWLTGAGATAHSFGLTLAPDSFLTRSMPCMIGAGGPETGIGTARSMTVTLALHLAILAALGDNTAPAEAVLHAPPRPDITPALAMLSGARSIVTLGQRQHGLAETVALGLCKLLGKPCLPAPCSQLPNGLGRILAPDVGVIGFRDRAPRSDPARLPAQLPGLSGAPLVVFDSSGEPPIDGAVTIAFPPLDGLAATLAMLSSAQDLVVELAAASLSRAAKAC